MVAVSDEVGGKGGGISFLKGHESHRGKWLSERYL